MPDSLNREVDDPKSRQRDSSSEWLLANDSSDLAAPAAMAFSPSYFLGDPRLGGRGNLGVHNSLMQSAQRTHGNRAVQRFLDFSSGRQSPLPVQRSWFDDATDWVGDQATSVMENPVDSLTSAAAYYPMPGNPFATAKAGRDLTQLFGKGHDEQGNSTPSRFDQGVNWVEEGISGVSHSLADTVSDVPILGSVAGAGARAMDFTTQAQGGAWKALGDMAGGIGGMIEHPLDAAMGIEKMAENAGPMIGPMGFNPFRMAHGVYDVASGNRTIGDAANHWLNPIEAMKQGQEFSANMLMGQQGRDGERHGGLIEGYRESWDQGKYGEIVGRAGIDIGSMFIGAGEARGAAEVGNLVKGVEGAEVASAAVRGIEGAEALRAVEGVEASRGVTARRAYLPERSPVPPPAPTASLVPNDLSIVEETTQATRRIPADMAEVGSAVGKPVPAPIEYARPAPIDFGSSTPTTSLVPTDTSMLDELTDVTRGGPSNMTMADELTDELTAVSKSAPVSGPASIFDSAMESFKKLLGGEGKLADAPSKLTLPEQINEALQNAWKRTGTGKGAKEHGFVVGQDTGGALNVKEAGDYRYIAGEDKIAERGTEGSFMLNREDIAPGETMVGSGHTHPYPDGREAGFSPGDLSNMIGQEDRFKMVQSGDRQYMSVKTAEYDAMMKDLDPAGQQAMRSEMNTHWEEAYKNAEGTFEERVRAANQATHTEYDMLYYEGEGGKLAR